MKKLVYVFLALNIVLSCKKNDSESFSGEANKEKLQEWFSKLAPNSTGLKKELKEKLKESLLLGQSWKSKGGPEGSMLIVPMDESYRLKNNANKQVKNYLTIEMDAGGNYTNGFIWQIAVGSSITNATFYNLYMGFEGDLNGSYDKLDVWDNLISRSKYENGKPKSFGQIETKKTNAQRTGGLVCTEYYEVTTHYDIVTGEILSQTSEYLYTTCICSSPNNVQSTILGPGDCDNSSGGDGDGDCQQSVDNCTSQLNPHNIPEGTEPDDITTISSTNGPLIDKKVINVTWFLGSFVDIGYWNLWTTDAFSIEKNTLGLLWKCTNVEHKNFDPRGGLVCVSDVSPPELIDYKKEIASDQTWAKCKKEAKVTFKYSCGPITMIRTTKFEGSRKKYAHNLGN